MPKDCNLVETNIYRVLKQCSNCPFKDNGEEIHLKAGRVDEIKKELLESDYNSFNCHKTVYNLDKDMKNGKKQQEKMCAGAYEYLKSINRPNISMRMAASLGIE